RQPKEWPAQTTSPMPTPSSTQQQQQQLPLVPITTRMTVRDIAEQKRQHRNEVYRQAIELAKHNIRDAMDLIRREMIEKYIQRGSWYLAIFKYTHLRAQRDEDARVGTTENLEYAWPYSFPHCTPNLRTYLCFVFQKRILTISI
ncbi:unnamed protein product, partial [Adineta ricciae]